MMHAGAPVAVVSGGSSGIGRAFVAQLVGERYRVVALGRDTGRLSRLVAELPGVHTEVCDVSDRAAVFTLAHKLAVQYDAIDLLISNAGGLRELDFATADLETADLSSELRINLEGAVYLSAAFMPALRKCPGSAIVFVTSGYALAPAQRAPLYSASKAGLRSFSKALRRQLRPLGINVTELAPPVVDTPAVAHRQVGKLSSETVVRQTLNAVRAGRPYVYPGQTRFLPLLLRLFPTLAESLVART
jgi:uncharacterized oxidoreductase